MSPLPNLPSVDAGGSFAPRAVALVALLPARTRRTSAEILERDDEATIQMLADILVAERNRRGRLFLCWTAAGAAAVAAGIGSAPYWAPEWHAFTAAAAGAALLLAAPLTRLPGALERAALALAAESKQKAVALILLEARRMRGLPKPVRHRMDEAIVTALEQLSPSDANVLTPRLRILLCGNLGYFQRDGDLALRLASLRALTAIGGSRALGVIYAVAAGEAATHTATIVRAGARQAMEEIGLHLTFGPISLIPDYAEKLMRQFSSEGIDHEVYAHALLALRHLLPQVDSSCLHQLSNRARSRLYQLLTSLQIYSPDRYGTAELQEAILDLARSPADTLAIPELRRLAIQRNGGADRLITVANQGLRNSAKATLRILEAEEAR